MPHEPKISQQWPGVSRTAVLENTGPPWETLFRVDVSVDMQYRVEATAERVITPAGAFDDCVLIAGHGAASADVGNYIGRTEITVTSREWFAPDVGLVRMEREETTTASAISGGSLVMELEAIYGP